MDFFEPETKYIKGVQFSVMSPEEIKKRSVVHVTQTILYDTNGEPVIKEIKRISKPGRRIYAKASSIPKIQNGLGLAIVSTSKGVMTDNEARNQNIGGEIICRVF